MNERKPAYGQEYVRQLAERGISKGKGGYYERGFLYLTDLVNSFEKFKDDSAGRRDELLFLLEGIMPLFIGEDLECLEQPYVTGKNVIATIGKTPFIGIGSHYDTVPGTPGANDNASAMAVTLDLLRRAMKNPLKNIGIRGFFFDEEENGLRGSRAYIRERGFRDMIGFYNMEMVGAGDRLAFWTENEIHEGDLLKAVESCARARGVQTYRFPHISRFMENSGDQESFIEAGMEEAFCVTAISERDVQLASRFVNEGGGYEDLMSSDLFRYYHKPTDTSEHLSEESLRMVSDVLWDSIREIDRNYKK